MFTIYAIRKDSGNYDLTKYGYDSSVDQLIKEGRKVIPPSDHPFDIKFDNNQIDVFDLSKNKTTPILQFEDIVILWRNKNDKSRGLILFPDNKEMWKSKIKITPCYKDRKTGELKCEQWYKN